MTRIETDPCFLSISLSQIARNNVVLKGRLAYNLTEGPSPNYRWLVKFDNDNKDEELYEHVFGKVLKAAEDDDAPTMTMPPPRRARVNRTSDRGSSDGEPKRVTFSESSPTASDDSGDHADSANVSAREKRSRLRQSKVEDAPPVVDGSKRRMPSSNNFPKNKRQKTNEEVVVVKLLTGTLYLYRGAHRRAEFVRRV